jgi:hypothetical protein
MTRAFNGAGAAALRVVVARDVRIIAIRQHRVRRVDGSFFITALLFFI